MGSLYKRGNVWWCKYYSNGRPIRQSTGCEGEQEAKRVLRVREGKAASGALIVPRVDRIRYDEIAEDLKAHYRATGSRQAREVGLRFRHLETFFAGRRVVTIGQAEATDYVLKRQGEGAANASINRELAVLVRMLRLACEHGKLLRPPRIRKLRENAPRQGFFEHDRFQAVRRHLPADLQAAITIAYTFGWRTQSEVLPLERRQLDLEAGTLRLDPGTTKNDEGRVVYLTPELKSLLTGQQERVETLQRRTGRITPYLFPHLRHGQRQGLRRTDFKTAWKTACKAAGCPGMLRHDFRRTAVRNMVNRGIPERVAMKISGHKTRAVFDRYHIVSPGDLQEAARKLAGTSTGTIAAVVSPNLP